MLEASNEQATILTDPMLISIVLERAKRKHSLLTINLPNIADDFLSVIVDIDDAGRYLCIDELKPEHGNTQLKKAKKFTVSAKLQGISIGFSSEILRVLNSGTHPSYRVKFPSRMQHRERRASHRVPVAMGLGVIADVEISTKESISLRVADISAEGVGLAASYEDIKKIMRSTGNLNCTIYFPEEEEDWTCPVEPCYGHRHKGDGREIQLGIRFQELTTKQREVLTRQLRFFDRENIRKAVRD